MTTHAFHAVFFDVGDTLVSVPKVWLPGAKVLLNSLHKDFRLGIISNTNGLTTRQAILALLPDDFDLTLFEPELVLFSSEIGFEKPAKEIFETAVARANTPPAQCLYCTENILETLVAQHVGMRTIRLQTAPKSDLSLVEQTLATFRALI